MKMTISYRTYGIVAACALALAVAGWWVMTLNSAGAQTAATITPYEPERAKSNTVEVSWGTVTAAEERVRQLEAELRQRG